MTCCGFSVIDPQRAIAWADSETYQDCRPSGHTCKIAINPVAVVVGIGTGRVGMLAEGADVIRAGASFDEIAERLPERLQRAARQMVELTARAPWDDDARYAIIGFSRRFGRVVGTVFDSKGSAPMIVSKFMAPRVMEGAVYDAAGALAAALDQMTIIRKTCPGAGAGALVVADLGSAEITTRIVADLATGCTPRRPIDFSAARALLRTVTPRAQVESEQDNLESGRLAGNSHGERGPHQP